MLRFLALLAALGAAPLAAGTIEIRFARALESGRPEAFRELMADERAWASGAWQAVRELIAATDCIRVHSVIAESRQGDELRVRIDGKAYLRISGSPEIMIDSRWWLTLDGRTITRVETEAHRTARLLLDAPDARRRELLGRTEASPSAVARALALRRPVLAERQRIASAAQWLLAISTNSEVELYALAALAQLAMIENEPAAGVAMMEQWLERNRGASPDLIARAEWLAARAAIESADPARWETHIDAAACLVDRVGDPVLAINILYSSAWTELSSFRLARHVAARDRLSTLSRRHAWARGVAKAEHVAGVYHRLLHEKELGAAAFHRAYVAARDAWEWGDAAEIALWLGRQVAATGGDGVVLFDHVTETAPDEEVDSRVRALGERAWRTSPALAGELIDAAVPLIPGAEDRYARRDVWRQAANTRARQQRYEDAVFAADESLREGAPQALWLAWATKLDRAQALIALGRSDEAIDDYRESIELIEARRALLPMTPVVGARYFDDKTQIYSLFATHLINLGRTKEALEIHERGRAGSLHELLGGPSSSPVLTPQQQRDLTRFNEEVVALNRAVQASRDPHRRREQRALLADARIALDRFHSELVAAHPETALRRGQALQLGGLRTIPDRATAILEYAVIYETMLIFAITRNDDGALEVAAHIVNISAGEIQKRVARLSTLLSTRAAGGALRERKEFYELLIAPFEPLLRGRKTICLIPDGDLWSVPFHALADRSGAPLLEHFTVMYAPSLTALELTTRKAAGADRAMLAIGDPNGDLPSAEREVHAVAGLYGGSARTGTHALESSFKAEAGAFRRLHIAGHGIAEEVAPLYSALVLAPDAIDDGLLEVREILALHLDADLVVLSACETARGNLIPGEGTIALSWAFLAAGTRRVIASQWSAESESTAALMIELHRGMARDGLGPAEALRRAQFALRRSRWAHPFYWAAFVVLGDGHVHSPTE